MQKSLPIIIAFFILLSTVMHAQIYGTSKILPMRSIPINYQSLGFSNVNTLRDKRGIEVEASGNIWIGLAVNGIIYWDGANWSKVQDTISGTYLPTDSVQCIKLDGNSDLWIATNYGITHRTTVGYNNIAFNSSIGFPSSTIYEIEIVGNVIFMASTSGLIKYNISNQSFTVYNHTNSNLANDTLTSITTDSQGNVWLSSKSGFAIYNNGSISATNYLNSALPNCAIYDIAFTASDTLLISPTAGIIRKINQQYISIDSMYFYKAQVDGNFCSSPITLDGTNSTFTTIPIESRLITSNNKIYVMVAKSLISGQQIATITSTSLNINPKSFTKNILLNNNIIFLYQDSLFFSTAQIQGSTTNYIYKVNIHDLENFPDQHLPTLPFTPTTYINQNIPPSYKGNEGENLIGNMLSARILNRGDLHWDPITFTPHYEVPFNSGKNTTYASSIWLGGYDNAGQLYAGAQTYRQSGSNDFWPGPLDTLGQADSTVFSDFDHIWMARKSDIDEYRYQYAIGNVLAGIYPIPNFILNWPAFYNNPKYPQKLAPFIDANGDNLYNPMDGDYPDVKGEQMAWWVFNDALSQKTETSSAAMGIEVQAYAYAINCNDQLSNSNALNLTTFYHYDLYNRSDRDYDSCFFGMWTDPDLGNASDDFMGSNIPNNTFFTYNGDPDDDGGVGYHLCPPVQNVTFLRGPEAVQNDNVDNNHDGIIDEPNEDIGFSRFAFYTNVNSTPNGNPNTTDDYYDYLSGHWLDGLPITYGGDGRGAGPGATTTPCNFMFPGNTDPNFSTAWSMSTANILPDDVRGIGSFGPFDLPVGAKRSFDIAFITGPSNYGPGGMALNDSIVANIRNQFRSGTLDNYQGSMPSINGPAFTAALNTYNYTLPIQLGTSSSIIWNVQNGTIISGQGSNTINVLWGTIGTGTVSVELLNNYSCKANDTLQVKIGTLGLSNLIQDDLVRVYPNPARSILNIESNEHKIAYCEIRNLQGQIVSHQTYSQSIDLQNLTDGVYFILLLDNNQKVLSRKLFVKE